MEKIAEAVTRGFNGDLNTKTGTAEKTDKSLPHNAPSAICPHSSAALASHAQTASCLLEDKGREAEK